MAHYQPPSHLPNSNDPRNWLDPRIVEMEKEGLRTFGQTVTDSSSALFHQDPRLTEMEQNRQRTLLQGTKYPISPSQFGEDYSINTISKFYPGQVRIVRKTLEHYYPNTEDKECRYCALKQETTEWFHIPIYVNVLKPLPETNEMVNKVQRMIEKANEILAQARIGLKYDVNINLGLGKDDGEYNDGYFDYNRAYETYSPTWNKMKFIVDEINPLFKKTKGRKIVIASSIDGADGFSSHPDKDTGEVNDELKKRGCEGFDQIIVIENNDNYVPEFMGVALAHEICHTLTLGKKHQFGENAYAGKTSHVDDDDAVGYQKKEHECNLMRKDPSLYNCDHYTLTEHQIDEIRTFAKKHKIGTLEKAPVKNNYKRTKKK